MAQVNNKNNIENGNNLKCSQPSKQRKLKQNSHNQKDYENRRFIQKDYWDKIVEKHYITEDQYSFNTSIAECSSFKNPRNRQFQKLEVPNEVTNIKFNRPSPLKNIRVITPTKQLQILPQKNNQLKEVKNKNIQRNGIKNDFTRFCQRKNPKIFKQHIGEGTSQNGLSSNNNSLKVNNNKKASESSRLFGQFNSSSDGIPAICLTQKKRYRPKRSPPLEANRCNLSIDEGETFIRSIVGVILKSSLEEDRNLENNKGKIGNSYAEFLVYNINKKCFNTIVQLKANGLPSFMPPGSWLYVILTKAIGQNSLKLNTLLIPKKILFCQRRFITRCLDGQVNFAVIAHLRHVNGNKFVFRSHLCDFLIDKKELIDPLIALFKKKCEVNNSHNEKKNEKNDDIPKRIRLWCFPNVKQEDDNNNDSRLEFKLKNIDERYYISNDDLLENDENILDKIENTSNNNLKLSKNFCNWFSECIQNYYLTNKMNNDRRIIMDKFVNLLNKKLKNNLNLPKEAKLVLFGSAISGFGSNDCDLDICLINCGIDPSLHPSKFIITRKLFLSQIATLLRKDEEFIQITAVLDARTPIVKFEHLPTGFHGDLSIDNILAIHNSELLKLYTNFDKRVAPLGFAIKCLAKLYGINNASFGSISSYAYIIMLIHYLQRCSPPILPFLQEEEFIIKDDNNNKIINNNSLLLVNENVEGWNVYYTKDINFIKERFNSLFINNQTLAELFFNFLYFYGFQFSPLKNIAQIHLNDINYNKIKAKMPIKRNIYVQDPFDLDHNLTSGVRQETLGYIIKCYRKSTIGLRQLDKEIEEKDYQKEITSSTNELYKMDFSALMMMYRPRRVIAPKKKKIKSKEEQQSED